MGLMDCWAEDKSGLIAVDGSMNPGFAMTVTLPGRPVLTPDAILVVSVGIKFVKTVNGMGNDMAGGGAMKIAGAW